MHGVRFRLWFVAVFLCFLASPALAVSNSGFSSDALPVFSDFDGDNKVDQAELFAHGAEKSIQVSFGTFHWKFFTFDTESLDRGRLVTDDIDRDGDTDLVWFSLTSPRTFVMWLGDGRGNFSIAQGHEHDRLQAQLSRNEQTRLTDNADGEESTCALQSTSEAALEHTPSLHHDIRSERTPAPIQPSYIAIPCLSVLFDRGPPTRPS
jgi:hypothetical protein